MNPSAAKIASIVKPLIDSASSSEMAEWYERQYRIVQAELDTVIGIATRDALENYNLKCDRAALRRSVDRYQFWTRAAGFVVVAALLCATYLFLLHGPVPMRDAGPYFEQHGEAEPQGAGIRWAR